MHDSRESSDYLDGSLGVAIIGMAARFPGAGNVTAFWENLCAGKETIHFFTDEELKEAGVAQADLDDQNYVKAAPILEDIDLFDAAFFEYKPIEATYMDPQHRILMECAWQALEDAGYTGKRTSDAIGVYMGIKMNTYVGDFFANADLFDAVDKMHIMIGNAEFSLGTRISYKFNLKGPSYMLQTGCSTSLAAVHLACQALLLDECRMALAGAVAIEIPHHVGYHYQLGGPASPDGHCRPFDAQSQGTVFGSGVGVVALKLLEDALVDGDHIYAVIRGTAVNNDGRVKASFTAPSVEGQTNVILEALACANVDADTISYIETHGTGTPLGDPIEMTALNNAFRAATNHTNFCRIGSVKGNVGHLDAVAGMAGLIKTVLALKYKKIPPSINFESPNPEIEFDNSPFSVNTKLVDWENVPLPRRAGVSSFGFGGTNTHAILEEAPPLPPATKSRPWQLLLVSTKTDTALPAAANNLAKYLKQQIDVNLADVAYTLQVGRPQFTHRLAVVSHNLAHAVSLLETENHPHVLTAVQEIADRPVVFMFPGQGTQYVNMGRELYQVEPVFREHIDRCAELLHPYLNFDLRTALYPNSPADATEKLTQTAVAQPILFAIEYALAQLWQSWGIKPAAMIGHSIGEYVAACLSGVFSLENGLKLVAARGRLMQQMPPGAMLAVPLSEQEVQPFLNQQLSLASINSPSRCVISGPVQAVEELAQQLAKRDILCRQLHTSHAFHSTMMDPTLEPFIKQFAGMALNPPQIPYISNVSGTWITAAEATNPRYWANHLRHPVRFADGIVTLLQSPDQVLLEVGPGQTLISLAQKCVGNGCEQIITLPSIHHPKDEQSDVAFLLNTLGALWLAGVDIDWAGFYIAEHRHRISLPTYPFERRRYWFQQEQKSHDSGRTHVAEPLTGKEPNIAKWYYTPSWKRESFPIYDQSAETSSCWLFFVDEQAFGMHLVKQLQQQSQTVILVRADTKFSQLDECTFTINPKQHTDYEILMDVLDAMGKHPDRIVHLWSITAHADPGSAAVAQLNDMQDVGFYSLLFLAQALEKQNATNEIQLIVVSNHVQDVTGAEVLCPEKATLFGPLKVIPLEYPQIRCRMVDVILPQSEGETTQRLVDSLLLEIKSTSTVPVVAYRGQHRWIQTFDSVDLPIQDTRLRQHGVYLITGGLGNIGLLLAQYLVETVQARLILTKRSPFPAKSEWSAWLASHEEYDLISRQIRQVQALEAFGTDILIASVDVSDREQMQALMNQAVAKFGSINGVFHAAGTGIQKLDKVLRLIKDTNQAHCKPHFDAKVYGTTVLKEVLQGYDLDFCFLFSSLASILGGIGFTAYTGVNTFLDAFAIHQNQTQKTPWLSINWDTWQITDEKEQSVIHGNTAANYAITDTEGIHIFQQLLSAHIEGQVTVSTGNLGVRSAQQAKGEQSRNGKVAQSEILSHQRPNLRTSYVAPRDALEQKLVNIWQGVLGVDPIGVDDNFFDLGGDSLIGLKLIAQLQQELNIEVPAIDLYEGPTVNKLTNIVKRTIDQTEVNESARDAGRSRGARRLQRMKQRNVTNERS